MSGSGPFSIEVNGKNIPVDNEGFLLDPEHWDLDVALTLADTIQIVMTEDHWEVVHWVREYFETNQKTPEARHLLKELKNRHGKEKGTRRYVYDLFPYGYGQMACKIAGLRKPLKLLLDL